MAAAGSGLKWLEGQTARWGATSGLERSANVTYPRGRASSEGLNPTPEAELLAIAPGHSLKVL